MEHEGQLKTQGVKARWHPPTLTIHLQGGQTLISLIITSRSGSFLKSWRDKPVCSSGAFCPTPLQGSTSFFSWAMDVDSYTDNCAGAGACSCVTFTYWSILEVDFWNWTAAM